ncbi:MAG: ABC transporter permease [Rhodoferax sp.]|nr:ABC transporter permease [Rhodoferax sp.]
MIAYLIKRLVQCIPLLLLVSLLSFGLIKLVPGDPAVVMGGTNATAAEIEVIRKNLGLDRPFHIQVLSFYSNLARGDLGRSLMLGQPVRDAIIERLPATVAVAMYSMVITLLVGLSIGVLAALRHNTWVDQTAMTVALVGVSLPNFWLGLVLILLFSVHLGWFPTGGYVEPSTSLTGWLRSVTLPAVSLAMLQIGLLARITRSALLEVLRQDYVRTARAKGLSEFAVIAKHAMANVAIPVVTVVGLIFSVLLSGSIIVETVFSVPGMGALLGNAILRRDYPMIQGGLLFVATALMLLNILVDLAYAWFDPRVRVGGAR